MTTVPQYRVTVSTPSGEWVMDVPSFQGGDAAGRRALFTVASQDRSTDLDEIKVVNVTAL